MDRRGFLQQSFALAAFAALPWKTGDDHPAPRPGINGDNVLAAEKVKASARREFEMAKEIPDILDGIRCPCDCAERDGNYSLLSCFEGKGMAQTCGVCRDSARIAHRLHKDGKTLDEIRAAIDQRDKHKT